MKSAQTDLLVPIDFKIYSLKSIEYAKNLIKKSHGKIHLLHVIESQSWWAGYFNENELEKGALDKLKLLKKEQHLPDNTELVVLQGTAYKEIVSYANIVNALFIIMSDNYPLTKEKKVLGSTLSQVIIKAEKPVISITEKEDSIFKNVVVPIDLQKSCRLQLYNSVALALRYNSTIHLVSVLMDAKQRKSKRLLEKIEKYKQVYEENEIDYRIQLLVKDDFWAYKSIINYCNQQKADSVLIMTHNEAAGFDNYIGVFAHHIINEATMPVITINNASAQDTDSKISGSFLDPFGIMSKHKK